MTEREHDDRSDAKTGHSSGDSSSGSGLIPDSDAGETEADSVSRDQDEQGHEEYKKP